MLSKIVLVLSTLTGLVFGNILEENVREYVLESDRNTDWWENAVFYEIYPRSFKDSDGNGFGDLQGIISKLHVLKDAGITAIWLSPINKSPGIDQGYDISDYRVVDPLFGTNDDLKQLLEAAQAAGIRIILDFVPNHTSDKHDWFIKSENRVPGYEDYYIWHNGSEDPKNSSKRKYPNNWLSDFRGAAWEWSEKRKQFYYHQFAIEQPDLNYRNPKVVNEIMDILTFWMDFGINGFRVDACPYFFEDSQLTDEPLAPGKMYDVNNPACLQHIYTKDQTGSYDIVYQIRQHVDAYVKTHNTETKVIMSEAYTSIDKTMLFYQSKDGEKQGAHFSFNFNFIINLQRTTFTAEHVLSAIHLWLDNMPEGHVSNWVLGNHDNHRIATRLGKLNVDGFNMLSAFLPGVMVTYNGEEIGMEDGQVVCSQGWDPQAIKNCSSFNEISRDFERTPYQWDDSLNAGFSSNLTYTWLPVSSSYKTNNLAAQSAPNEPSHFNIYKELIKFRKTFHTASKIDTLKISTMSESVIQLIRVRDDGEYMFLFNIANNSVTLQNGIFDNYVILIVSSNSQKQKGRATKILKLEPHESVIFKRVL